MEKREKSKFIFISIFLIFLLSSVFYFSFYNSNHSFTEQEYIVTEVIDGDTIIVNGEYARLIGINAPEKNELKYNESKEFLSSLILNKSIIIEYDIDKRDNYGRLLVYVFVDDVFINRLLVKEGYAVPMSVSPNTKYKEEIEKI